MKHLFLLLICLGLTKLAAPQARFAGIVNSNEAKPISNANVILLNTKDSSLVKGVTTNNNGAFLLEKIAPGNYLAVISNEGFHDKYFPAELVDEKTFDIGVVMLSPVSKELKDVVVTGKKPMFDQKIDRLVVNVKGSITNAGSTVLEVLEKSPGVTVNRSSGTISMNGKNGVQVMINGKMNYMPADAVLQMLNGMNASTVEKIELITNPPAKYDAEGNAGYINIVLTQSPDEGFNGSIDLSMGALEGTEPKAGVNFNYRKRKVNLYGSYSFSRLAQLQNGSFHRRLKDSGSVSEIKTETARDPYQRNHNARIGMDYSLSKKTVIGALLAGYDNKWEMDAVNNSVYSKNGVVDTSIVIDNHEVNHWKHLMGNLNLQHIIKDGEDFSVNTDYLYYHNENPTDYLNNYYNAMGHHLSSENTFSGKVTDINIWVSQFDYAKRINSKTSIQLGAKGAFSTFTNDVLVQEKVQDVWLPDNALTAIYHLHENIGAAYASLDQKLSEKTMIKGGLRYEYTYSHLYSEKEKDIVNRKYGKLFPTFYISHKLDDRNSLNFSYSRRINRPSFRSLAPFLIFVDPKTFISGNAALQPALSDGVRLGWVTGKLVFSGSYTYTSNFIANFQVDVDTSNNTQTLTAQNIDKVQIINLSASIPINITKWWFSQVNLDGNWQQMKTHLKNGPIDVSQVFFGISGAESFKLPKRFSIELAGFFQTKSFNAFFGASTLKPIGKLNMAVQKKFNASALTLGVDDIFSSFIFRTEFTDPNGDFYTKGDLQISSRIFKISYSLNFGSKVLKDKRSRETASEDEQKRAQ